MIYLNNTSTPQMVYIPKGRETVGILVFSLKSTINQNIPFKVNVFDLQSDIYVQFKVELSSDIATGEYEYTLTDAEGVISTGLLVVGDASSPTEYNKTIQYEQY